MKQVKTLFSTALCIVACAHSGQTQSVERIPVPDGVFYYQPAASVNGSEAAWMNPAVLGTFSLDGIQVMADYFDESFARSWGLLAQHEHLAAAYRRVCNPTGVDYKEYLFASGLSLQRQLNLGV